MEVNAKHVNGVDILTITPVERSGGRNVNPLIDSIDAVLHSKSEGEHPKIVVDMREVPFMHAATLQTMIGYHKELEGVKARGGGLKLVVSEDQLNSMKILSLDKIFDYYLTVEAAVETYK